MSSSLPGERGLPSSRLSYSEFAQGLRSLPAEGARSLRTWHGVGDRRAFGTATGSAGGRWRTAREQSAERWAPQPTGQSQAADPQGFLYSPALSSRRRGVSAGDMLLRRQALLIPRVPVIPEGEPRGARWSLSGLHSVMHHGDIDEGTMPAAFAEWIPDPDASASLGIRSGMTPGRSRFVNLRRPARKRSDAAEWTAPGLPEAPTPE